VIGTTCMLLCGFLALPFAQRTAGARSAPGLPCALLASRVEWPGKARATCAARRRWCVCSTRCHRPRRRTIQHARGGCGWALRFDYAVPITKSRYDIVQEFRCGGGTSF